MRKLLIILSLIGLMAAPPAFPVTFNSDVLRIGNTSSGNNPVLQFDRGNGSTNPQIRYNIGTSLLEFSSNGSSFSNLKPAAPIPPVVQVFTSGSGTFYDPVAFYVSSANATAGATYTNNGQTFTVYSTISGGTVLLTTVSSATLPTSSGTLTKASGTGDATISFSSYNSSPIYLDSEVVGGGGGGGADDSGAPAAGGGGGGGCARKTIINPSSSYSYSVGVGGPGGAIGDNDGSSGGTTTLGTSFITANGGSGGEHGTGASPFPTGGAGGTASGGDLNLQGGPGGYGVGQTISPYASGSGGNSGCGGGGALGLNADHSGPGNIGTNGGGGSGAANNSNSGGNGGPGYVRIVAHFQ